MALSCLTSPQPPRSPLGGAHPYVSLTEEKLPVQVGVCDCVHVGDGDVPTRPRCQPHHGKVLQQLAADGAGSHLRGTATAPQRPGGVTPLPTPCSPQSTSGGPAPPGSQPRTRQSVHRSGIPSAGRGIAVSGGGHGIAAPSGSGHSPGRSPPASASQPPPRPGTPGRQSKTTDPGAGTSP